MGRRSKIENYHEWTTWQKPFSPLGGFMSGSVMPANSVRYVGMSFRINKVTNGMIRWQESQWYFRNNTSTFTQLIESLLVFFYGVTVLTNLSLLISLGLCFYLAGSFTRNSFIYSVSPDGVLHSYKRFYCREKVIFHKMFCLSWAVMSR